MVAGSRSLYRTRQMVLLVPRVALELTRLRRNAVVTNAGLTGRLGSYTKDLVFQGKSISPVSPRHLEL